MEGNSPPTIADANQDASSLFNDDVPEKAFKLLHKFCQSVWVDKFEVPGIRRLSADANQRVEMQREDALLALGMLRTTRIIALLAAWVHKGLLCSSERKNVQPMMRCSAIR